MEPRLQRFYCMFIETKMCWHHEKVLSLFVTKRVLFICLHVMCISVEEIFRTAEIDARTLNWYFSPRYASAFCVAMRQCVVNLPTCSQDKIATEEWRSTSTVQSWQNALADRRVGRTVTSSFSDFNRSLIFISSMVRMTRRLFATK